VPIGPGKYDDSCTSVRETLNADAVILIVLNGTHGNGFSVQAPLELARQLPEMLRHMADEIENSV
jgi:hypothetical protein